MQTKRRKFRFALLFVAFLVVCLIVPSGSALTVPAKNARSISVSDTLFQIRTLDGSLWAFPIQHGPHRICVQFSDGEVVWAQFFNSDVGERPRMDIFADRQKPSNVIVFRQTINQKKTIFTGQIKASQTSSEKPYSLDWI